MMFFAMLSPIPGTSLYSGDQRFSCAHRSTGSEASDGNEA
jgi:hypothetical protein